MTIHYFGNRNSLVPIGKHKLSIQKTTEGKTVQERA